MVEKAVRYKVGQKVNEYIVIQVFAPEIGMVYVQVKCSCGKVQRMRQENVARSQMCKSCSAQLKSANPRPKCGETHGDFLVHKLTYDGKTADERRYSCTCNKCGVNTFVSERKLIKKVPCGFCKY
jgi:hypothetical protein